VSHCRRPPRASFAPVLPVAGESRKAICLGRGAFFRRLCLEAGSAPCPTFGWPSLVQVSLSPPKAVPRPPPLSPTNTPRICKTTVRALPPRLFSFDRQKQNIAQFNFARKIEATPGPCLSWLPASPSPHTPDRRSGNDEFVVQNHSPPLPQPSSEQGDSSDPSPQPRPWPSESPGSLVFSLRLPVSSVERATFIWSRHKSRPSRRSRCPPSCRI
jgi:hypothetical protein